MDANQLRKRVEELIELERRARAERAASASRVAHIDWAVRLQSESPTLLPAMLAALECVDVLRKRGRGGCEWAIRADNCECDSCRALARFDAAVAEVGR